MAENLLYNIPLMNIKTTVEYKKSVDTLVKYIFMENNLHIYKIIETLQIAEMILYL